MSIIGLRFRSMAARIKVLSLNHPDLAVEKLRVVISNRLAEMVDILYHQIDIPRGWSDCRLINI